MFLKPMFVQTIDGGGTTHDWIEHMNESTQECLKVEFPARSRFLSLARLNAAAMAAGGGFDVDQLDDVRLAVGEAVGWLLLDESAGGSVKLTVESHDGEFRLQAERVASDLPNNQADDLVDAILGATLDSHELGTRPNGERWVELHKERIVVER